jgi:hypothetical protein
MGSATVHVSERVFRHRININISGNLIHHLCRLFLWHRIPRSGLADELTAGKTSWNATPVAFVLMGSQ